MKKLQMLDHGEGKFLNYKDYVRL